MSTGIVTADLSKEDAQRITDELRQHVCPHR